MNRPLNTWLLFAGSLALLLAAMAWVSLAALRLDEAQTTARRQAEIEEKVRLALWRIDSALAPVIAREGARPYFAYRSFYPAERAYNRMFNELRPGEVLVPSPLLGPGADHVFLHFQFGPDGELTSPQVPAGPMRQLAETRYLDRAPLDAATNRLRQLSAFLQRDALLRACAPAAPEAWTARNQIVQNAPDPRAQQLFLNSMELQARAQNFQQQVGNLAPQEFNDKAAARANVTEGAVRPVWLGEALVLARRVTVDGRDYAQGCWLDWPKLARSLLTNVQDLLPRARLQPIPAGQPDPQGRMLAALPARLVPGAPAVAEGNPSSPIRLALLIAWICVAVASAAVAVLLHGALSLSERRAAFVSAVTHELRTPLTTFKMYSEMLAAGMVADPEKRRKYLDTLCAEADRLGHLVENVLAYARLERGSARGRVEKIRLGGLLERVKPRLEQRAVQAGLTLVVEAAPGALELLAQADVTVVEQILFNLVDNACKYAAPNAVEKFIHLEACPDRQSALLRVRDHGRGISREDARRLFRPFSKSAEQAAGGAPGIGLGLALCRRLSRGIGGDLWLDAQVRGGACFVLRLPAAGP